MIDSIQGDSQFYHKYAVRKIEHSKLNEALHFLKIMISVILSLMAIILYRGQKQPWLCEAHFWKSNHFYI